MVIIALLLGVISLVASSISLRIAQRHQKLHAIHIAFVSSHEAQINSIRPLVLSLLRDRRDIVDSNRETLKSLGIFVSDETAPAERN